MITVYADYVCPFSYLSLLALDRVAGDVEAVIEQCAFELRPAPSPALAAVSDQEWQLVSELATGAGFEIRRPARQPRTRKAHEATKFAASVGMQAQLRRAIFAAHFVASRDIGRIDVLAEIGHETGLDAVALKVALDADTYTESVLADEALAQRIEIEGTPTFIAGGDMRVGYLSEDHFRDWLKDREHGHVRANHGSNDT